MPDDILNSFMTGPDEKGRFGEFRRALRLGDADAP